MLSTTYSVVLSQCTELDFELIHMVQIGLDQLTIQWHTVSEQSLQLYARYGTTIQLKRIAGERHLHINRAHIIEAIKYDNIIAEMMYYEFDTRAYKKGSLSTCWNTQVRPALMNQLIQQLLTTCARENAVECFKLFLKIQWSDYPDVVVKKITNSAELLKVMDALRGGPCYVGE